MPSGALEECSCRGGVNYLSMEADSFGAKASKIIKSTVKNFLKDECPSQAAAISFYAVTSLPPLLIIFLSVVGLIYDSQSAAEQLTGQVEKLFGDATAEFVGKLLDGQAHGNHGSAAVLGTFTLLLSASGLFGQLQSAINRTWGVRVKPGTGWKITVRKRLLSMVAALGAAFLLLLSLIFSTLVSALGTRLETLWGLHPTVLQAVQLTVTGLAVAALFSLIYKILPDVRVHWGHALKSGLLTTLLFVIGKFAFEIYLGNSDPGKAYGSAASMVLFLFWIFYSANMLLLGAELTQAIAENEGFELEPRSYAEMEETSV